MKGKEGKPESYTMLPQPYKEHWKAIKRITACWRIIYKK